MRREVADGVKRTAAMDGRREVADPRRGTQSRSNSERCVPSTSDRCRPVLSVGAPGAQGGARGVTQREARAQTEQDRRTTQDRGRASAHRGRRTQRRDAAAEKRALAIEPHRRYAAPEKQLLLDTIQRAHAVSDDSVRNVLQQLGIASATYYRWTARAEDGRLLDDPYRFGKRA